VHEQKKNCFFWGVFPRFVCVIVWLLRGGWINISDEERKRLRADGDCFCKNYIEEKSYGHTE
jgi:hypothetical protein